MSTRYPGGFINRSAPVIVGPVDGEGGSAPGVWTLEQASYYTKQGTWPLPTKQRPLFSWGQNTQGQLGQLDRISKSSPVQVGQFISWNKLACTVNSAFVTNKSNQLWSWGSNDWGQLGLSDKIYRSSPVQIGSLTTWGNVGSGAEKFVFAIKTDGSLWSWGKNSDGQLGQNNVIPRSSPVQVGSLTNWSQATGGYADSIFLKTDKTLWACGRNGEGMCGQSNVLPYSSPVQIGTQANWYAIATGNNHVLATKTDGTLWSWGYNPQGQLGQNNRIYRSSPTQVGSLTTWLNVGAGFYHSLAIKTDGTLWSWGSNDDGQLGQNTDYTLRRSSPVQVGGLSNWSTTFGAKWGNSSGAIKSDGTLWTWGNNGSGRLGVNNTENYSSPIQVGLLTSWSQVAFGQGFMIATQAI